MKTAISQPVRLSGHESELRIIIIEQYSGACRPAHNAKLLGEVSSGSSVHCRKTLRERAALR